MVRISGFRTRYAGMCPDSRDTGCGMVGAAGISRVPGRGRLLDDLRTFAVAPRPAEGPSVAITSSASTGPLQQVLEMLTSSDTGD